MRVLVAEDHVKMAEAVAAGLRREGMAALMSRWTASRPWTGPASLATT